MVIRKPTPDQQRTLLRSAGMVLGFLAWLTFFYLPVRRQILEIRPQAQRLRQQLEETRGGLANLSALEEEFSRLAAEYDIPSVELPPEDQVPELLKAIAQMARSAQVRVLEVTPRPQVGTEASTPVGLVALEHLTLGQSGYLELPIEVQAVSGYHALGLFLDKLEQSKRLVRVRTVEILPDEQDLWHHRVALLLQAYLVPAGTKKAAGE